MQTRDNVRNIFTVGNATSPHINTWQNFLDRWFGRFEAIFMYIFNWIFQLYYVVFTQRMPFYRLRKRRSLSEYGRLCTFTCSCIYR